RLASSLGKSKSKSDDRSQHKDTQFTKKSIGWLDQNISFVRLVSLCWTCSAKVVVQVAGRLGRHLVGVVLPFGDPKRDGQREFPLRRSRGGSVPAGAPELAFR